MIGFYSNSSNFLMPLFYICSLFLWLNIWKKKSNLKQMLGLGPGLKDIVYHGGEGMVVENLVAAKSGSGCLLRSQWTKKSVLLLWTVQLICSFTAWISYSSTVWCSEVFFYILNILIPPDIQMAAIFPLSMSSFFTLLFSLLYRSFLISCHPVCQVLLFPSCPQKIVAYA